MIGQTSISERLCQLQTKRAFTFMHTLGIPMNMDAQVCFENSVQVYSYARGSSGWLRRFHLFKDFQSLFSFSTSSGANSYDFQPAHLFCPFIFLGPFLLGPMFFSVSNFFRMVAHTELVGTFHRSLLALC
jgi:hypothetical protein